MNLSTKQSFYYLVAGVLSASLFAMPAYAANKADSSPVASLSASASVHVDQDRVQITLAAQEVGAKQDEVASALNKKLDAVMKDAKAEKSVTAKSGMYRIWPTTNRDGNVAEWRGQAEIILESADFAKASDLAAKLADRMPINGISFSVSNETRIAQEQGLLEQAVSAFERRAQALSTALGFDSYAIKNIDLGGSGHQISPMPKMMLIAASADGAAAAPIEGGQQELSLEISGQIYLLTAKK